MGVTNQLSSLGVPTGMIPNCSKYSEHLGPPMTAPPLQRGTCQATTQLLWPLPGDSQAPTWWGFLHSPIQ